MIRAIANLEVTEIQQRGLARLVAEEGRKQQNIESIISMTLESISQDAKPEAIDDDWLFSFFDRSKLV